jgi:hypothetical protein
MLRVLPASLVLIFTFPVVSAPRLKDLPPSLYYPTTVGDRWVTETKWNDNARVDTNTEVVTDVEKKDGEMIVTVGRESGGQVDAAKSQVKITEQGIFRMAAQGQKFDPPYHILKTPLKVGSSWSTEVRSSGTTFKYKVTKEEEIEVPAGKFKTFRLDVEIESGGSGQATIWYAPRVGIVRHDYKSENSNYSKVMKEFKAGK